MTSNWTRHTIVILLVIASVLSYVDRGNLSVVVPEVKAEFKIDDAQMGWLMSAFFWSYALMQIWVGGLTDKYDVKLVFAGGFLLWTIATLLVGFAGSFAILFLLRMLLGIGESVIYPSISRILLEHFPEDRRGLPNALVAAGAKIGPAVSMALGGLIASRWGWRPLFIFTGVVSLIWLIPWMLYVPNSKQAPPSSTESDPVPNGNIVKLSEILSRREFWGTTIGLSSYGYASYFMINWLPSYLENARGFTKDEMAQIGAIPFWVMALVTIMGGILADRWIRKGLTPTRSRYTMLVGGMALCAVFMVAVPFTSEKWYCIAWLTGSCVGMGMFASNTWAVTQTLAGSRAACKWSGMQNAFGNLAGAASSIFTGNVLKQTGSFDNAFFAAVAITLCGIGAYLFMVGPVRPVIWADESSDSDTTAPATATA